MPEPVEAQRAVLAVAVLQLTRRESPQLQRLGDSASVQFCTQTSLDASMSPIPGLVQIAGEIPALRERGGLRS